MLSEAAPGDVVVEVAPCLATGTRQLAHQALHDQLTHLPNRALFLDRLGQALTLIGRHRSALAVIFCDLDRFKVVNDSLGHDAGDRLLVDVATRLTGALRAGDTAARFGGDEFVILCEDIAGEQQAIERRASACIRTSCRWSPTSWRRPGRTPGCSASR